VITNVYTGRPARGLINRLIAEVGPISKDAPEFPLAAAAVAPLRSTAESESVSGFTALWSGQAAALARELPAGEMTAALAADSLDHLAQMRSR
jgi:nitronate monooxygenase